jgi:hypothetical protein
MGGRDDHCCHGSVLGIVVVGIDTSQSVIVVIVCTDCTY